jgi:hypothetical protein
MGLPSWFTRLPLPLRILVGLALALWAISEVVERLAALTVDLPPALKRWASWTDKMLAWFPDLPAWWLALVMLALGIALLIPPRAWRVVGNRMISATRGLRLRSPLYRASAHIGTANVLEVSPGRRPSPITREKLSKFREMYTAVMMDANRGGNVVWNLERHPTFIEFEPHLATEERAVVFGGDDSVMPNSTLKKPLWGIRQALLRLEAADVGGEFVTPPRASLSPPMPRTTDAGLNWKIVSRFLRESDNRAIAILRVSPLGELPQPLRLFIESEARLASASVDYVPDPVQPAKRDDSTEVEIVDPGGRKMVETTLRAPKLHPPACLDVVLVSEGNADIRVKTVRREVADQ